MSITVSIGVLSLQGSVEEHLRLLSACEGVQSFPVKSADALNRVDGLILPGGESTTMARLLRDFQLSAPLLGRIRKGLPVWGTCAGLILLAKQLVGEPSHLGVMDITVRRNAYGRQINSFSVTDSIPPVADHPLSLALSALPGSRRRGAASRYCIPSEARSLPPGKIGCWPPPSIRSLPPIRRFTAILPASSGDPLPV